MNLGTSSFVKVYLAEDEKGEDDAIKKFHPEDTINLPP